MIKLVLRAILINAVALFITAQYIQGVHLSNGLSSLLIVTLIFSAIHLLIKPVIKIALGVINFLTFGLLSLAIDVGILHALAVFLPQVSFSSWLFPGWEYAGFIIPNYYLSQIGSMIAAALVINFIRSGLNYLSS